MTCNELSDLIIQNRATIAFLVGNGIHNYEYYENHISGKVDWNKLIMKVRDELFPEKMVSSLNSTLSLPRQFDSIIQKKDSVEFEQNLKKSTKYLSHLIDNVEESCILNKNSYYDFPYSQQTESRDNMSFLNHLCQENKMLQQVEKEIRTRIKRIMASAGINFDANSCDALCITSHIVTHGNTDDYGAKQIIKTIFENYTLQEWIVPFLQVAEAMQSPILTTNYDISLSKLACLSPRLTLGANINVQKGFPFETYFAPSPINHPWDSFAIWHIHGLYNYVNSIRIGQADYGNLQREIQERLNKTTNPLTDNVWDSNNSWLSIVFRKNLFIIGLGLEADEEVLWWLLKERAKYGLKGWYVCRETEELSNEKICNLQDAGLNVVKADNVDLYENVWKILLSKLGGVKTKEYQ